MTEEEVTDKLTLLCLAEDDPALDSDQLADITAFARRPDADGNVYGDTAWTPTYDIDAAAAEGWRRKAGLAAARFSFAADGQRFDRAQIYAHCIQQADFYARRSMGSIPTSTT